MKGRPAEHSSKSCVRSPRTTEKRDSLLASPRSRQGARLHGLRARPSRRPGPLRARRALWLERAGLRVDETLIGDASPVQAIADILVQRGPFSAIIISTQPRRISRWLKLDVQARVRHRFSLPVISVFTRREAVAIA